MTQVCWPSSGLHKSFSAAVEEAIVRKIPLVIESKTVIHLTERIFLKTNGTTLRIVGGGEGDSRPLIISSAHSLVQVGGRGSTLLLENLRLHHACFREEHKDIGAVVFGLYKAKIVATECEMISDHGFGVWAVQRASIELKNCSVSSLSRSGCVSFGRSTLLMEGCKIYDCKIHGVCSRGTTVLNLNACNITACEIRGVYAYHNVTLSMTDTTVTDTKSCLHAAVDLWGCSLESSCRDDNSKDPDIIEFGASHNITDKSQISNSAVDSNKISEDFGTMISSVNCSSGFVLNKRPEREGSNIQVGIAAAEELKPLTTIIREDGNYSNYSYNFAGAERNEDNLNVNILRCVISDNKGLGLRIRQGRLQSSGSRIVGSITSCTLRNNTAGDISENFDGTDSDVMAGVPTRSNTKNKVESFTVVSDDSASTFKWEYERDDPSTDLKSGSPITSRDSWQPYQTLVSEYVQSKYEEYLKTAVMTPAVHPKSNNCERLHDSKDNASDDGCKSVDDDDMPEHVVHLPMPFQHYNIDFCSMQQTNSRTLYMRNIRRVEV